MSIRSLSEANMVWWLKWESWQLSKYEGLEMFGGILILMNISEFFSVASVYQCQICAD